MADITGEDLLQQDLQRPPIHHDVVIGEREPVAICCGADHGNPEGRLVGEIADRCAFVGVQLLDLLIDIVAAGVQLDIPPGRLGVGRDDLHRIVEL